MPNDHTKQLNAAIDNSLIQFSTYLQIRCLNFQGTHFRRPDYTRAERGAIAESSAIPMVDVRMLIKSQPSSWPTTALHEKHERVQVVASCPHAVWHRAHTLAIDMGSNACARSGACTTEHPVGFWVEPSVRSVIISWADAMSCFESVCAAP